MTPEQIDAMPAGREMDALVVEKVMGWSGMYLMDNIHAVAGFPPINHGTPQVPSLYSTDMAAAWQVVEKLSERWSRVEVHSIGREYCCMVEKNSGGVDECYIADATAETAPLAICRAALKAVSQ